MNYLINLLKEVTPPHKHKTYEIIVYTKGSGILHIQGKDLEVTAGKIIVIPPGTVHHTSACSADFERLYINGDLHQFFNLTSPTLILDNAEKEGVLLAKMIYNNRHSAYEYVLTLINAFTHFLLQNIKLENEIFLAVKMIVDAISNQFYDSSINLHALLKKSGYAEDYIRAQFKKIMGKTPIEFLTEIRIKHACYLIDTYKNSFSLADVAEQCGYIDYVYFSRRFKQMMGMSPSRYKESL